MRVDTRQLDILVKLSFFSEFGEINYLLAVIELFNKLYNRKTYKVADLDKISVPLAKAQEYCQKSTEKTLSGLDWKGLCREAVKHIEAPKTTVLDRLRYENEFLGYNQTISPKVEDTYYFVQELIGYSKNVMRVYQVKTGEIFEFRNRTKQKVKEGDLIKIHEIMNQRKWRKDGKKWYQIDEREKVATKISFET